MTDERPAPVVRLAGAGAAAMSVLVVCVLAWGGNATSTSWSAVGRPLHAVPALVTAAVAAAAAVLMGVDGVRTAAGSPRAASRAAFTALSLGLMGLCQGVLMLGTPGAGIPLALGLLLIGLAVVLMPGSRLVRGRPPTAGGDVTSLVQVPVTTDRIDPEVAALGPPYPYPMPLPPAAKAAHIAAIAAWQRRGLPWVHLTLFAGVMAVTWSLMSDTGRRARGTAPTLWETHTALAAGLLVGGLILVAATVRPVVRIARGVTRHRRLLTAYGVRLDKHSRELPPTIPTSPQGFLR